MSDLSALPRPVREAVERFDGRFDNDAPRFPSFDFDWDVIRTELLRMTSENVELRGANKRLKFLHDALHKRVDEAQTVTLGAIVRGEVAMSALDDPNKRVRLVVCDE